MRVEATPISMPRLGLQMREGTVVEWRARAGERVEKGRPVLVIESDKAEVEIAAPATGVLRHVYVDAGATVPCGTLLGAVTVDAAGAFDAAAFRAAREPAGAAPPAPTRPRGLESGPRGGPAAAHASPSAARAGAPVTPAARRRGEELGVDVGRVPGTGPGGRVTREDVEATATRLGQRVLVAPGVRLEVAESGDGEPVVLLPGIGTDLSIFARVVPPLAQRFRVRAVNPRGVGLSDAGADVGYDVATAAADAEAVLQGRSAHVVGTSFGAAAALALALRAPGRVRTLALVTPLVRPTGRLLAVVEGWCALAEAAPTAALARAIVPWLFSSEWLGDPARRARAVRAFAESASRVPAEALRRQAAGLRAFTPFPVETLAALGPRTLVVVGGDDLLTPDGAALVGAIPGARLVVLQGAGHAAMLEAPEDVSRALIEHFEDAGEAIR